MKSIRLICICIETLKKYPMDNRINLKPEYQKQLIEICEKVFGNYHVEIMAFGSRVNGNARISSDIDLAVKTDQEIPVPVERFREMLEESTIPYTVDVVFLKETEGGLTKEIVEKGIVLWKN